MREILRNCSVAALGALAGFAIAIFPFAPCVATWLLEALPRESVRRAHGLDYMLPALPELKVQERLLALTYTQTFIRGMSSPRIALTQLGRDRRQVREFLETLFAQIEALPAVSGKE